jgi:DUF971 family protein
MPLPLDSRRKPVDVKVRVSTGEGVEVAWSDGHTSRYDFPYLREHCPCAMCNDERARKSADRAKGIKTDIFPMYKARVKANSASAVGSYAIQIDFSDGHSTGIYSFSHLREICPCQECRREFGALADGTSA